MRIDKAISSISLINIRVVSCRVDLIDNHPDCHHLRSEVQIRASVLSRSGHHDSHKARDKVCNGDEARNVGYFPSMDFLGYKSEMVEV